MSSSGRLRTFGPMKENSEIPVGKVIFIKSCCLKFYQNSCFSMTWFCDKYHDIKCEKGKKDN